jgi:MFS family permease
MTEPASERANLLDPLRSRLFLMLWIANMASNVGTQIQSVGEKWQMAHLTTSPLLVALIETGTTLPVLLLGLSAGAIADILDRRKLLLATQVFMMVTAGALSGLTFLHQINPAILLAMSFLIGVGSALSMPAFQAIVPELLDRKGLAGGVALNSAGFNVSRAVGPAVGGLIVGLMGAGWAFGFNAVSFLAVVVALLAWKRRPTTSDLPGERFLGALKVGFRYARHSRPFQVILLWAMGYSWFAGVIFSLVPALAIHDLKLSSQAFGGLMSCIGAGAVAAVFFIGPLRQRFSTNQVLGGFSLLAALAQAVIAYVPHTPTVALCLFLSGMSWLAILSTVNTAIQFSVPPWVKARAFGTYHTVWGGAMALGAAFWGALATKAGLRITMGLSAAGMIAALVVLTRLRITAFDQDLDLSPHRDSPHGPTAIPQEAGPILVQMEYTVPRDQKEAFLGAMNPVRRLRLRDGAMRWALFEEPDRPVGGSVRFLEAYLSSTMGEHLRQHHRATAQDRALLAGAYRFTEGGRPTTRHLVVVEEHDSSMLQKIWQGWAGE